MSLALLAAPATAGQWAVTYSGSTVAPAASYNFTNNKVTGPPPFDMIPPNGFTVGPVLSLSARAPGTATLTVTTTLTWAPSYQGDTSLPPSSVGVIETGSASASIYWVNPVGVKQPADDGFGDSPISQMAPLYGATSSGSHFTTVSVPAGAKSVTLPNTRTVTATLTCTSNQGGSASVSYTASVTPVTVSLSGPIQDSSGSLHIQVGQQCTAQLSALPNGFTVKNLQWTAVGNTIQGWTSGSTGGSTGKASPYTLTQVTPASPGPVWYWSDTLGPKIVTCSATATPPIGSTFTITATQNVILDVPTWSEMDSANPTRIDSLYLPITGPALWAGSTIAHQNGSQWNDGVTSPGVPYTGNGDWAHLQIITINGTHGSTPVPNNGITGLDGGFPYRLDGNDYIANGMSVKDDGDSPGINLLDTYSTYNLSYSFDLYVMYNPPGDSSIWVPLTKLTWTWGPNVSRPATGWSHWPIGTAPGGNPKVPSAGTRCIDEPAWTTVVSEH